MLKEYRFEKFVNVVRSKGKNIDDEKAYYKVNGHWVNAVIYKLLFDRATSKGYKIISNSKKQHVYKDCKYYIASEFEFEIIFSKERNI